MTFKLAAFPESTYVFLIPNIAECQLQQQWKQQGIWVVLNKRKPRSLFLKLSAFTPFNRFTFSHLPPPPSPTSMVFEDSQALSMGGRSWGTRLAYGRTWGFSLHHGFQGVTVTGRKALALGLSKSIGEKRIPAWDAGHWVMGHEASFSTGTWFCHKREISDLRAVERETENLART